MTNPTGYDGLCMIAALYREGSIDLIPDINTPIGRVKPEQKDGKLQGLVNPVDLAVIESIPDEEIKRVQEKYS